MNSKVDHHELKIAPEHFTGVILGSKLAEFRLNDRDFKERDVIRLREWAGDYTGREVSVTITDVTDVTRYIASGVYGFRGGHRGFVMLSFRVIAGSLCNIEYIR